MKPPKSLSDEELMDYADHHIIYELEMLRWTTAVMGSLAPVREEGQLAWACNNALLNSFSIHARNLIDFLYLRSLGGDRPTDIIVQDYIDEETLTHHLPPITSLLRQAKRKADKQAVHLTLDRVAYEKSGKEWSFVQIVADIMGAFRAIAPVFPETRTSESFRQLISQPRFLIPDVRTNPTYSGDGVPSGIAFQISLRAVGSNWEVKGIDVSA
jgi:hypothetical protein